MDDRLIWLWLSLHFGAGSTIYEKLYKHFGSAYSIYDSDDGDMECIDWLTSSQKKKILDKNLDHAREISEWCDDNEVRIIAFSDEDYPSPLKSLVNFPAVLYCKGSFLPDFENDLCIAVVGTRKMTVYGQKNAYEIGFGLAKAGVTVVSGMALGIDCTAQKGALYAGGKTIAVLGSGIDVIYPKANTVLMQKILYNGAVITEYPPSTPPNATNFPTRNRIISGLCQGTVVVEGDINSGSLITARDAVQQGRELFAVPGPVHTFSSGGPNKLIKDGAHIATDAVDIVEEFLDRFGDKISISGAKMRPIFEKKPKAVTYWNDESRYSEPAQSAAFEKVQSENGKVKQTICEPKEFFDASVLSENERKLYDFMEPGKPITADEMCGCGMKMSEISATLIMLEIVGAIKSLPGARYIKK